MKKKVIMMVLAASMLTSNLVGCSSSNTAPVTAESCAVEADGGAMNTAVMEYGDAGDCYAYDYLDTDFNSEEYSEISENGFTSVAVSPRSTFSADVDTASYSNVRRMIMDQGYGLGDIPTDAVRIEEMVNYFNYDYNIRIKFN